MDRHLLTEKLIGRDTSTAEAVRLVKGWLETRNHARRQVGPEEWVSLSSLRKYRRAIVDFVNTLPAQAAAEPKGGWA